MRFVKYPPKKWREQKHSVLRCLLFSFMIQNTQQDLKKNTKLLSISWSFGYLEKSLKIHGKTPMFKKKQLWLPFSPNFPPRLLGLNSEVPTIWRDSMDPILVSCPSYVPSAGSNEKSRRIGDAHHGRSNNSLPPRWVFSCLPTKYDSFRVFIYF